MGVRIGYYLVTKWLRFGELRIDSCTGAPFVRLCCHRSGLVRSASTQVLCSTFGNLMDKRSPSEYTGQGENLERAGRRGEEAYLTRISTAVRGRDLGPAGRRPARGAPVRIGSGQALSSPAL